MISVIIALVQSQQAEGISWVVWTGAAVVFVAGIVMLVLFLTRLVKQDRQIDEQDWTLSQRTLILDSPASEAIAEGGAPFVHSEQESEDTEAPAEAAIGDQPVVEAKAVPDPIETASLEDQPDLGSSGEPDTTPLEIATEEALEPRVDATTPFDKDVWEELELEPAFEDTAPLTKGTDQQGTQILGSPGAELSGFERVSEQKPTARLEAKERPTGREPFEPPSIGPIVRREPFAPPSIEPLKPREAAPFTSPIRDSAETTPLGSQATSPVKTDPPPPSHVEIKPTGAVALPQDSDRVESVTASDIRGKRPVSGSVLGLTGVPSGGPLILGDSPPESRAENLGMLSKYDRMYEGERTGHGGTIALIVAIVLVGGSTLAYLFMPEVKARVDEVVAKVRGAESPSAIRQRQLPPEAQIHVSRYPQVVNNIVKPGGSVFNVAEQPVEALVVEVTLERRDGSAEKIVLDVTPEVLGPGEKGAFEFEYDGRVFRGYRITRLSTRDGRDLRFIVPAQQGQTGTS